MKTKILSLLVVLSVVLSLGIAVPASAASTVSSPVTAAAPSVSTISYGDEPISAGIYDERYVSVNGNNGNTGKGTTAGTAWRTITHAAEELPFPPEPGQLDKPDRINVLPSSAIWYGYNNHGGTNANAEHIFIEDPVVVRAYGGDYNNTIIDIGNQDDDLQVIEITSSNVTINGFKITGAAVGVLASGLCPEKVWVDDHCEWQGTYDPIHDVYILNNNIVVNQTCPEGTGIMMCCVKYAHIEHNIIDVECVNKAFGIVMNSCLEPTIIWNTLTIYGNFVAIGMCLEDCPKGYVYHNTLDVKGSTDSLAIGIKAGANDIPAQYDAGYDGSDLIDINTNIISVESAGIETSFAFGIKVSDSDRSNIEANTLTVVGISSSDGHCDLLLAEGILLKDCSESTIADNPVTVTGYGNFNSDGTVSTITEVEGENIGEEICEFIEDIEDAIVAAGGDFTYTLGAAAVVGIKVSNCNQAPTDGFFCPDVFGHNQVYGNTVNVYLAADFFAGASDTATGCGGLGAAFGIFGYGSPCLQITENYVHVDKTPAGTPDWRYVPDPDDPDDLIPVLPEVMVNIYASSVEALGTQDITVPIGIGIGLNVVLGITLLHCDGATISENTEVEAEGSLAVDVITVPTIDDLASGSTVARLNSDLLSAIYAAISDTAASESVGVKIAGGLPSIESFDLGGGLSVGIAILVYGSNDVVISENEEVEGVGSVMGSTYTLASADNDGAEAWGAGLGLGGGIWVICSNGAKIVGNDVEASGLASFTIEATHAAPPPPVGGTFANAYGGAGGVAIGILVVDGDYCTEVFDNGVYVLGSCDAVEIEATEENCPDEAEVVGLGLGLGIGIASFCTDGILIKMNDVVAEGNAVAEFSAEAVTCLDPSSTGGAVGGGVGIVVVWCDGANIIDNTSVGRGTAYSEIESLDNWTNLALMSATAFGGSLGFGEGILVIFSCDSCVIGNSVATGQGDAEACVSATNEQPPPDGEACAFGLAIGIGNGIGVFCSPKTDVKDCNTAAGVGSARLCSEAEADFDYACGLAAAISIDIAIVNIDSRLAFVEPEHRIFGIVNYNSMVDVAALGSSIPCTFDAGLLSVGGCLNAEFNWWNDPTGPSCMGPGNGEKLIYCGGEVTFSPWLYVVHTKAMADQIGYFGFSYCMEKGVNTFSTPILLSNGLDPNGMSIPASDNWALIKANSGLAGYDPDDSLPYVKWALRWVNNNDPLHPYDGHWEGVDNSYIVKPLEGFYIYFKNMGESIILMADANGYPSTHMNSRLLTRGWNLIGPNPLFSDCDDNMKMPADIVLRNVVETATRLPGYTQVVSPGVPGQHAWAYAQGTCDAPNMWAGKGYWVYMLNEATLIGYGFSPLPDKLSKIYDYYD